MKNATSSFLLCVSIFVTASQLGLAQSLSSGLGATKLDGLTKFSDCQNQALGHREHLIGDRLDAKLAVTTTLNPEERNIWVAEIRALRDVTPSKPYKAPDEKNSQRYFLGLTNDEQVAINSMHSRYTQEINLACEKKYGGMLRYSQNSDQSGQTRYEKELQDKMQTPIDIATIPVTPLPSPFPKTREQMQEERRAARQASRQAANQTINSCVEASKGLRLTIIAEKMQKRLDSSKGLSAKDRAEFEADIKATRDAAAKKLDYAPPVDPSNPNRALMRLTAQEQMEVTTEFSNQYMEQMKSCTQAAAPSRTSVH